MFDPEFDDDYFDTHDRIVGEEEFTDGYEQGFDDALDEDSLFGDIETDSEGEDRLSYEHWGMAFALGDELSKDKRKYDLDEETDAKNYCEAMRLDSQQVIERKPMSKFDRIIDDICKGRRSLFDTDY